MLLILLPPPIAITPPRRHYLCFKHLSLLPLLPCRARCCHALRHYAIIFFADSALYYAATRLFHAAAPRRFSPLRRRRRWRHDDAFDHTPLPPLLRRLTRARYGATRDERCDVIVASARRYDDMLREERCCGILLDDIFDVAAAAYAMSPPRAF